MRQGKVITFNHTHVCRPSRPCSDSVITLPVAQGLALAINSTVILKEASTERS
jgi:hypothetical protein